MVAKPGFEYFRAESDFFWFMIKGGQRVSRDSILKFRRKEKEKLKFGNTGAEVWAESHFDRGPDGTP